MRFFFILSHICSIMSHKCLVFLKNPTDFPKPAGTIKIQHHETHPALDPAGKGYPILSSCVSYSIHLLLSPSNCTITSSPLP